MMSLYKDARGVLWQWSGWRVEPGSNSLGAFWTAHFQGRHFVCTVTRDRGQRVPHEYEKGHTFPMEGCLTVEDALEREVGQLGQEDFDWVFALEKAEARADLESNMRQVFDAG